MHPCFSNGLCGLPQSRHQHKGSRCDEIDFQRVLLFPFGEKHISCHLLKPIVTAQEQGLNPNLTT